MMVSPYGIGYSFAFGVDGELGGLAAGGDGRRGQDLVDGDGHGFYGGKRNKIKKSLQKTK